MNDTHIQNYATICKETSGHLNFVYIDTGDHLAEYIFYRYDTPVHVTKEFSFPGTKYRIVIGWLSDEYRETFADAMAELRDMMSCDYERYCQWMLGVGMEMLKAILKED